MASEGASNAPFGPAGEDWQGLSQFVSLAEAEVGKARLLTPAVLDFGQLTPADAVVLVHPERPLDVNELGAFMRAGGRVVLLDDYGSGDELLAQFGIRRRALPDRPTEMLRGNPSLAIAEPASDHTVVRGVTRVVTNHATGLEHPDLSPVLIVRGRDEPDVLLSVAGSVGRGRLLAVGDSSVAINEMLRYPGNRAFAVAFVRYATEDDSWGKRGGKVLVLTNGFDSVGSFQGGSPSAAGVRRAMIAALDDLRRNGTPPFVLYAGALTVALGLLVWTASRAGKTHTASLPRFVREVPVIAHGGIAGHAAILGSPGASRTLAMLELKCALEEELSTLLGLERAPSHEQIVEKVRAEGLLDEDDTRILVRLFASLTQVEGQMVSARRRGFERTRDAEVIAVAGQIRRLLGAAAAARRGPGERGNLGEAP